MSLKLFRRKGSALWNYRGTIGPDGRRQRLSGSCYTTDKAIAARQVTEIEKKYWDGHFDGPGSILTFDQAAVMYLAAGKSSRFLEPVRNYLKDKIVEDIKPSMIRQMANELFPTNSGASKNRRGIVPAQAVINHAAESELCQPIRVKRFKEERKEKDFATLEWIRDFQAEASPQLGAFALFMFLTGARPTEALECDIDLGRAEAKLHESKIGHERKAHLQAILVTALANLPEIPGRSIFFYRKLGDMEAAWGAAIDRAGIERLTPHQMRHGHITGLLRAGVDVKTVSWLCDISPATLLKHYAHALQNRRMTEVLIDEELTQRDFDIVRNPRKTGTT